MTDCCFNYTIEPLEGLIFILIEDSSPQKMFSAYPQKTQWLYVRDKW